MLKELDFNYKLFIDKTTILYGETKTGKSFIIVDILHYLKPHVEQIIVISPTDRQNNTYSKGIVPTPCIHYTMTGKLLDDIWERQNALSAVYKKASNPKVLKMLFDRVHNTDAKNAIERIKQQRKIHEDEIHADDAAAKSKIADMENECNELVLLIYKHYINENRDRLSKLSLSADEAFTLKYLNLNPRMVLIFDDCTDLLKKFKSHPVMQKLFYQGRWAFITAMIACHTDKALDAELKKNAYVNIYTEDSCAHAYFVRPSSDLDRDAKTRAAAACKCTFSPILPHQKLAWIREEKKFYKLTASPRENFRFGSPVIWEYCKQIQADAGTISANNKFLQDFI